MQNQIQDSNQNLNSDQNQPPKKEPFSFISIKILLAVLIFTALTAIIIGGWVYVIGNYGKNETNNKIIKSVNQATENYYDVLEKKCGGDNCCVSSLRRMRENNYKEADKNGNCLEGFFMDMMKCVTSYQWCVPIKEDCKKHGEIPGYTAPGDDMSIQCCDGLEHKIQKKYFDEDCVNLFEKHGYGGYAGICINCGDGVCDTEFENKCNCPEDCEKEINTSDLLFKASATDGWQTYRNEEFGFKYPNEWKFKDYITDNQGSVIFFDLNQKQRLVVRTPIREMGHHGLETIEQESILILGTDKEFNFKVFKPLDFKEGDKYSMQAKFYSDEFKNSIELSMLSEKENRNYSEQLFKKILSTFKFID